MTLALYRAPLSVVVYTSTVKWPVRWVRDEGLHLTLKFIGEQPETSLEPIASSLEGVAARHDALALGVGGLGAFPNLRAPRIVWVGVSNEPRLELLHHDVERACEALGIPVEGRAFRPHITLGRVKRELPAADARALAGAARSVNYGRTVDVRTVDVMSSTQAAGGSRYAVQRALPLGGG